MSVNEYITKFTQLSRYAPHEVNTDEKKQECFLNGLNDGLAHALEAQDFENIQEMVNKALVLENHRGVIERKCMLVHLHQRGSSSRPCVATSSAGPLFHPAQPQFQPKPHVAGQGFSTPQHQVFSAQIIFRPLLLGIRVFRGLKLLRTHYRVNGSAMLVGSEVTLPTNAPIRAPALLRWLCSYCCQAELCSWEGQSCCCGGSPGSCKRGHWYVFLSMTLLQLC
jgi:hypothetical protein